MNNAHMRTILSILSLLTALALIAAINIHPELSNSFYMLGGTLEGSNAESGNFNTFFLSSLGITSAIIVITYLLVASCKTLLTKALLVIADFVLIIMTYNLTQERVLHNFNADVHVSQIANTPDANAIVMGTSDATMLTIVFVHVVIMLIGVIRTYKSKKDGSYDKAAAYDQV